MIRAIVYACVLTGILLAGPPAAAEQPEPLTGAFDPEQVLRNLESTVKERDWQRYADFLAPGFRFTPFSAVTQDYHAVNWEEWGRKEEVAFVREMVGPNRGATLDLIGGIVERGRESRDKAEWDLVYNLESMGQVFRSRAIFVFEKIDNLWYLLEWTDTTIETDEDTARPISTSGTLRGALSR